HRGDARFGAPVEDVVELLGATLIDFRWIAQAPLACMAAISIQDDADVARHRLLFKLIKEPALVNPIKETQEKRSGRTFVRWLSLPSLLPDIEPGRGSLFITGEHSRAFVGWAATGIHRDHPLPRCPMAEYPAKGRAVRAPACICQLSQKCGHGT